MLHPRTVISFSLYLASFSALQALLVDEKFLVNYIDYFKSVYFNNSANLTEQCKISINGSKFLETKMFDATSKIPTGIFESGFDDLGNFDECYEYNSTSGEMVYGKYCLGRISIKHAHPRKELEIFHQEGLRSTEVLTSGFCLPNTCTLQDFKSLYYRHNFSDMECTSKADIREYSVWFKLMISILIIMVTMVFIATVYDCLTDSKTRNLLKQLSGISSCRDLFSTELKGKEFTSLYGLRCITMAWIVLHHTYLYYWNSGMINRDAYLELLLKPQNVYLTYGDLSVTIFFTIGAVLTSYNFLKHYEKDGYSLIWNCIRRYVRLTPLVAVMTLFDASLYEFGNGPLWNLTDAYLSKPCKQYWWSTLLFVQNYVNPNFDCVPQAWYLAVDMQCYVIFSILLLVLSKKRRYMVPALLVVLATSPIVIFFIIYNNNILLVLFSDDTIHKKLFYKPTHARFGAYVAGLLVGIWLHEISQKKIAIPVIFRSLILSCLALVMCSIFAVGYFVPQDVLGFALLMAAKEILLPGIIGVLILMCESGNAEIVKAFLSLPCFKILTKLTYGMYLVSMTVTLVRIVSSRVLEQFSVYRLYQHYFSDFVTSLIISFLLYIFLEIPFANVGNYVLSKIRGAMKSNCSGEDYTVNATSQRGNQPV